MKEQIYAEMPNGQRTLKISSPWSQLGFFLVLLGGAYIATSLFAGVFLIARVGISNMPKGDQLFEDPKLLGTMKVIQAFSSIIIFGIPAYFCARMVSRDRPLYYLGLQPARLPLFYLLAIAVILLSIPVDGWLGQINRSAHLPQWAIEMEKNADKQIGAFLKAGSNFEIFLNVILIALLPAIFEEACFRGALQRILIQCFKNPWIGIIATAIFFSAFHMQFAGFLPRVFLGILLGALYWYSGSLWVSILAHFVTNAVQVVAVSFYPQLAEKDPTIPFYAALISLLIVVVLLFVMRKISDNSFAREYGSPD